VMHATAAIALTLFDDDTPIWLDHRMAEAASAARWLKFHTSAPVVADSSVSQFALIGDGGALLGMDCFCLGSNEYPDRSTTLILQVESLAEGPGYILRGPGIDGTAFLRATIAPEDLFERLAVNATLFPRGIDVVLVHDDAMVAIPRTTRLIGKEG
jgi:alpha-D-ribose 1-methylphosphonate 5-triphosphate synthase subunit PhnH